VPRRLAGIPDSLERTVTRLTWRPGKTTWGDYYEATNYTDAAFSHKREIVTRQSIRIGPRSIWDLGANDGTFSRLGSDRGIHTVRSMWIPSRWRRTTGASSRPGAAPAAAAARSH
jgi:hypothetical protein